jgi:hypothetical protein
METSPTGTGRSRMPIIATVAAIAAVFVTAVLAMITDDSGARAQQRAAVLADVDTIRIAELSLVDFEGKWTPCGSQAASLSHVEAHEPGFADEDCWKKLGFHPNGPGGYWVEVVGDDFAVHGVVDLDADGIPAEFVATREMTARTWTDPRVF